MKQYNVTISYVQIAGFPTDAMYTIAAQDSKEACREALHMARSQFPQSTAYCVKFVSWDGNSAVL